MKFLTGPASNGMEPEPSGEKYVNPIYVVIALAAVFIGVTGLFVWMGMSWHAEYNELAQPVANLGSRARESMIVTAAATTPGIGSELYDAATTPVGELPSAAPEVPNPIQDVYQNPFD